MNTRWIADGIEEREEVGRSRRRRGRKRKTRQAGNPQPNLQWSDKRLRPGFVNFVPAVAYTTFALNAAFTQPGLSL